MTKYPLIACPHCGNANKPQQTYCGYCSNKLYPAPAEQVPQTPEVSWQSDPMQIAPERKSKASKQTAKQIIEQQQQDIKQLRVDLTELQGRYIVLETAYLRKHRNLVPQENNPKTGRILTWIAVLCSIALIIVLYFFFKSQGGLPPEITNLLNS